MVFGKKVRYWYRGRDGKSYPYEEEIKRGRTLTFTDDQGIPWRAVWPDGVDNPILLMPGEQLCNGCDGRGKTYDRILMEYTRHEDCQGAGIIYSRSEVRTSNIRRPFIQL